MRTARLVFVSTPYASIDCKDRDRSYYAKQLAKEACKIVRLNGYEPISPILAFMDIYSEFERDKIMKNCEELLRVCSYYYYFQSKWSDNSRGMQEERAWAKEYGLSELKFSLFE
ncbi:hypothetical protein KDE13_08410 [Campylobacter sp. faydin G-140]|uniref:DUF7768 domain-containing protein n=1 Tax=Campylobacter anatolicus TaxID=2829105 RepID=UPI001B94853C|nr:hypothetical protein [Campylobacter anatolicus]MBR8466354.1 hypothetical protein [Campylobacter anatolicus]